MLLRNYSICIITMQWIIYTRYKILFTLTFHVIQQSYDNYRKLINTFYFSQKSKGDYVHDTK